MTNAIDKFEESLFSKKTRKTDNIKVLPSSNTIMGLIFFSFFIPIFFMYISFLRIKIF